ncbi:major facilitator superfamily domain-containing protein [Tricladium varicosporioides]|nr:major facilitator superfamily domain-containing protein [Hymenoscyphus varicosporioides]
MEKIKPTTTTKSEVEPVYPDWRRLTLIMIALYMTMFLVALDRTIIATAIPKITDVFHSINDVGWYAGAYMLTLCAFQLIYGRIYTFYSAKWVLLSSIFVFEVGSVICGAAPSSIAFIVGRAIAGLGSAGIFSGCVIVMVNAVPLHKRPMFQGLFGAVFGVASIAGPLLGGVFTSKVSWRWCFYINLPIGAVAVLIILCILESPPSKNTDTLKEQFMKLDPLGSLVFLPGIVCLLLALQWGGVTYPWKSARIIALFILAGLLLALFVVVQFKSGDRATVPIRIIKQRSIASGCYFSLIQPGSMMVLVYFLPLYFQAIKGVSAVRSGIDTLPMILALVLASIMSGIFTAKTGYYVGQLFACSILTSIGAGLLTMLKVDTPSPKWIGFQILYGYGLGLGMQQAGMAAQTCLKQKDVMTGVSLMFFFQGLGGALFVCVGQLVFTQSLVSNLSKVANLNAAQIVGAGATELRNFVPASMLPTVLIAYNAALSDTFKLGVGLSAASIITAVTMEWKDVRKNKKGGKKEADVEAKNEEAEEAGVIAANDDVHTDVETVVGSKPTTPEPATKTL